MSTSKLMKVTYYDPKSQIRLLCYADTVVWDTKPTPTLTALRFGGYPERVQGLADAIYGGAMTGWCLRCGGQDLQSGISIPDELSGDALLERIYREMEHYRPFEHRRSDGT